MGLLCDFVLLLFCLALCWSVGQATELKTGHHLEPDLQVAEAEQPMKSLDAPSARETFQVAKIFDFQLYKRLFKRVYHGLEETVRRKLMLARALRAWISSIKYKFGRSSFYLALNHLSDKSPEELERRANRYADDGLEHENLLPDQEIDSKEAGKHSSDARDNEVDFDHVEEELLEATSGPELREATRQLSRRKRTTDQLVGSLARNLDADSLISTGEGVTLDAQTTQKVDLNPISNNPNYERPEMMSNEEAEEEAEEEEEEEDFQARDDNIEPIVWYRVRLPEEESSSANIFRFFATTWKRLTGDADDVKSFNSGAYSRPDGAVRGVERKKETTSKGTQEVDEVFFDHRWSRCMLLPRDQGDCSSCYAFAAIAIAEWLHCNKTGKLVAFSEQYMIDCGHPHLNSGCQGGNRLMAGDFIHNYGLELRTKYPYRARVDQCPYDASTEPKSMGFIRMDLLAGVRVPSKRWADYIESGPMYIGVSVSKGAFYEYGGGVMDGVGCEQQSWHAATLIGHGRQDGLEYWLIRNSDSVGWGERGHLKLAKGSKCVHGELAIMYGTTDGHQFNVDPRHNQHNNHSTVKSHYLKYFRETTNVNGLNR